MKKSALILLLAGIFCQSVAMAQDDSFGISAGYLNGRESIKGDGISISSSESGFYLGLFYKAQIDEKWAFVPEASYGSISELNVGFLSARVLYYPAPKFSLQAGPQFTTFFEKVMDGYNKSGVDLGLGLGYDISDHFSIQGRYSFELTNRLNVDDVDATDRFSWMHIGLAYAF